MKFPKVYPLKDIAQIINCNFVGDADFPVHGMNEIHVVEPDLGVGDFAASVVYMANQSGANWKNPDDAMLKKIDAEIQRRQAQLRK